jgi:hypothetical protein
VTSVHPLLILSGWLDTSTSTVLLCLEPPDGIIILLSALRVPMPHKPQRETPIERIYREVMGPKMPLAVRRILLCKRKPRRSG